MKTFESPKAKPDQSEMCWTCRGKPEVVVWSLRLCGICAERANWSMPTDAVTGVRFTISLCALVQYLRECSGVPPVEPLQEVYWS